MLYGTVFWPRYRVDVISSYGLAAKWVRPLCDRLAAGRGRRRGGCRRPYMRVAAEVRIGAGGTRKQSAPVHCNDISSHLRLSSAVWKTLCGRASNARTCIAACDV